MITRTIFDGISLAAGGTLTSDAVDFSAIADDGYGPILAGGDFSLQWIITGSGTVKVEYRASNDGGVTYSTPTDGTLLLTGKTVGNGFEPIGLPAAGKVKFVVTETGGAQTIASFKLYLAASRGGRR